MKNCNVIKLGLTDYKDALAVQRQLFKERHTGDIEDTLVLAEHNPIYTCGRSADATSLIKGELPGDVELIKVDRGGSLTFHGPGQLMIYPIISLKKSVGVMNYLRQLEQVAIRTLAVYGIKAGLGEASGVFVGNKKIASVGIKISGGVTMHGLSLNVNCDLRYFEPILACGLKTEACCMKKLLGYEVDMEDASDLIIINFGKILRYRMREEKPTNGKAYCQIGA